MMQEGALTCGTNCRELLCVYVCFLLNLKAFTTDHNCKELKFWCASSPGRPCENTAGELWIIYCPQSFHLCKHCCISYLFRGEEGLLQILIVS